MRFRVVYVHPDQSLETVGVVDSMDLARRAAATFIPPVGYLRPEAVEIRAGRQVDVAGVLEWTDADGAPVDAGPVNDLGGIEWQGSTPIEDPTPSPAPLEVPEDGIALTIFDALDAGAAGDTPTPSPTYVVPSAGVAA